jgi:hypothetical protein
VVQAVAVRAGLLLLVYRVQPTRVAAAAAAADQLVILRAATAAQE